MRRVLHILLGIFFAIVAVGLLLGILIDVSGHLGPGTGALNTKAAVELSLLFIVAAVFARWSYVFGRRARGAG